MKVKTNDLSVDNTNIIIQGIFVMLLLVNTALFANREFNVYMRYKGWYEINIKPLQSYELAQRT